MSNNPFMPCPPATQALGYWLGLFLATLAGFLAGCIVMVSVLAATLKWIA